jgi:hypothetical protein
MTDPQIDHMAVFRGGWRAFQAAQGAVARRWLATLI